MKTLNQLRDEIHAKEADRQNVKEVHLGMLKVLPVEFAVLYRKFVKGTVDLKS